MGPSGIDGSPGSGSSGVGSSGTGFSGDGSTGCEPSSPLCGIVPPPCPLSFSLLSSGFSVLSPEDGFSSGFVSSGFGSSGFVGSGWVSVLLLLSFGLSELSAPVELPPG
ncbi:hypothetical protein [Staphylococcus simulans]|uniref:hypothetical protein n=1 Tax=Staphylococcus simulans TaxID=1286 RepID=UPI0011585219|nr:hypothetical protein [Staphylococcus simulans]